MSSQDNSPENALTSADPASSFSRYVKIGEWFFEIKMVRALKVKEYGAPYDAIANCNINGDSMYIDGLLTRNDKNFTRDDFATFHKFAHQVGVEHLSYHRYQNGESVTKDLTVDQALVHAEHEKTIKPNIEKEPAFEQVMHIVK